MSIIQTLLQWYDAHRIPDAPYWITQSYLYRHLDSLPDDLFMQRTAGTSSEGRPIRLLSLGSGPTPVLLWSQMHGDEPTATRALLDIFSIVRRERDHEIIRTILSQCTLYILPMVNPDGAERFSRRTALGIDMNRDALALRTPEAAILKSVRNKYNPRWAYSLHDQEPRYTAGGTGNAAGISLLSATCDWDHSITDIRRDTMRLASCVGSYVQHVLPDRIARYDEAYEPRAFGDVFHSLGTRCVLIESGYVPGDRYKESIRKANAIAILASLHHLSRNQLPSGDLYTSIPMNRRYFSEYIFKNAGIVINGSAAGRQDAAMHLVPEPDSKTASVVFKLALSELGDCDPFASSYAFDGSGLSIRFNTGADTKRGLPEPDELLNCEILDGNGGMAVSVAAGTPDCPIEEAFGKLLV
jgi:hypothetical protein